MKERPILMHARSINGILESRKTQTRRIIANRSSWLPGKHGQWQPLYQPVQKRPGLWSDSHCANFKCPFGIVGDRLWVREYWRVRADQDHVKPRDLPSQTPWYCATGSGHGDEEPSGCAGGLGKMRPGIFMPRWASRLTLEVVDVRVEHVQDISEADAKAEGCQSADPVTGREVLLDDSMGSYRLHFQSLWDDTNGKGAWHRNDWVWVVQFKRLDG